MPQSLPIVADSNGKNAKPQPVILVDQNGENWGEIRFASAAKQFVSGANGVSLPAARSFLGISVTTLLAGSYVRLYDAASASGEFFMQLGCTAVGQQVLPTPIALGAGLFIQPSALFTGKLWVFYR